MSYDTMVTTKTRAGDRFGTGAGFHTISTGVRWLVLGALINLLVWVPITWAQNTDSLETVSSQLAAELVRYFPPVTGEVVKVDGKHLYVDLGAKDEVWTGLRLLVYRQGEVLKHPTTGAVVGHDELQLGDMTLVRVSENHAVGIYIPDADNGPVQPGDKVRLTAARIAVSLAPPTGPLPTDVTQTVVSTQLKNDLEATGRFRVQGAERVNAWLLERSVALSAVAESPYLQMLTRSLKTPYLIQPVLKAAQGQTILTMRLLAATQTAPVAEASAALTGAVATAPAVQEKTVPRDQLSGLFLQPRQIQPGEFPWNLAEGMTEVHRFEDDLIGLDAGDLDNDGRIEVVIATASHISLYQLNGETLQLIDTVDAGKAGHFISAQLMRLEAPSPIGIVVNYQREVETIQSFVLTLQGQKLGYWQRYIYETLLAVDSDGDGINDRIWGQPFDATQFFVRDRVRVYVPGNGKLIFQNNRKVPFPFRATGGALAGLGLEAETERYLVFVDERHRLRVYRGREKLWESADQVGGSYAQAQLPQTGEVDVRLSDVLTNTFLFEPIPETVDVDGDGVDEVLVIRNGGYLGGIVTNRARYRTGDVALLRAGPYGYTLSAVSPKFDGMVSGVSVVPNPAPGVLVAISKRQGVLGRKKQTIIFLSRLPLS